MSTIYNVGSAWKGFSSITRLVIFGDSYSSVDSGLNHDESKPNAADPLGLPFPGLWNDPDKPNWVGHLITKFRPGPRYRPPKKPHRAGKLKDQSKEWIALPLLVHDYARAGDTLGGVGQQIQNLFLPGLGKKPAKAAWTAENTLFVWVGINDCAYPARDDAMEKFFALQDLLYNTGARNFLFINVPPSHRSPAVRKGREENAAKKIVDWNNNLCDAAKKFSSTHADSSVFLLSSFQLFNTLLDDPTTFGFDETDIKNSGGPFWFDHIHPTSKVHEYIASYLTSFLFDIPTKTMENTDSQPMYT